MAKLGASLLIVAVCIWAPLRWAAAAPPAERPQDLGPMPEALYLVVQQAEQAGRSGDIRGAAAILTDYLETHPGETHPYPYYDAGYFLHQAGNRDAAVGYLKKAVKLSPSFIEAWQLSASIHQEAGETGEAAAALEKAAAIEADPRMWYQTAVLYLDAGLPRKALTALKKVPREQRKTPDWYVASARTHQELKAWDKAAGAMASAYALSKDPEQLYQCALIYLEAGKPEKALPLLRRLTGSDAPKAHWLVALSNTLKALKKKEETAQAMERAARMGRDPNLWFHAAWLWLDAGCPQKALPLLQKLAGRKRPQVEWLVALANTYMILEHTRSAAETMDRVVRLDPKPEYLYNAGMLWLHAEQPKKALHHLLRVCKRSPAKAEWFVALAHAWFGQEKIVNAARAMERAATISHQPEHAYQAGLMWLQARQADAALRLLVPLSREPKPRAEWLVALSNAWILKGNYHHAAAAMEQAATISEKPDHVYSAAGLWLQAERPRKALPLLEGLAKRPKPESKWLVLLSETRLRLGETLQAAQAMERAAQISGTPDHIYRAARLWLGADRPKRAFPLLEGLARQPSPSGEWLIALSNCYLILDKPQDAAGAMEKGAEITQKGADFYRAGMLWLQAGNNLKGISLLQKSVAHEPVEQRWLVSLAQALVNCERDKDALAVMDRTGLTDTKVKPAVRYEGALLWLHLNQPQKALSVLKVLCAAKAPALDWLVSLLKTHVELEQMTEAEKALARLIDLYPGDPAAWRMAVWVGLQQADYAKAAAAMAVAVRLGPPDADQLKKLADLYHMAGVPIKAAEALQKAWTGHPIADDWDRLTNIYLSGHRYDMALKAARSAVAANETATRWQTVGAIAYHLRRFQESYDAYCRSAELSPDADALLKAGYAALKMDRLDEAASLFQETMRRSEKNAPTAYEAHRNLAFINKMLAMQEEAE